MVVQCGIDCAVWYRLYSVVQVLINRSIGSVPLWFDSSMYIFLFGWQDEERKGGRNLLPVIAEKLGS